MSNTNLSQTQKIELFKSLPEAERRALCSNDPTRSLHDKLLQRLYKEADELKAKADDLEIESQIGFEASFETRLEADTLRSCAEKIRKQLAEHVEENAAPL